MAPKFLDIINNLPIQQITARATKTQLLHVDFIKDLLTRHGLDYAEPGLTNLATVLSYLAQRKTTTPIITDDLLIEMKTGPFGAELEGRPQQTGYRCILTYHGQEILGSHWHSKEEAAMDAFATEAAHLSRQLTA